MSDLIFHDNWLIFIGLVVILLVAVL